MARTGAWPAEYRALHERARRILDAGGGSIPALAAGEAEARACCRQFLRLQVMARGCRSAEELT